MSGGQESWALGLYKRSVLKQQKFAAISGLLEPTTGKRCLDIGADNGVISLLLRQGGGDWASADLAPEAVESIRSLVGGQVERIGGGPLPFADNEFDCVVVVDFLEHIPDDQGFAAELGRVLRPGGQLIVNVPRQPRWSLVWPLRHAIGLTDQWHGHLRPGYRREGLAALLEPWFEPIKAGTYCKTFSELLDTALNFGYVIKKRGSGGQTSTAKGTVVTQADWQAGGKGLVDAAYPVMKTWVWLDKLLPFFRGYRLIVSARRRG
ncbi:MAG: class I SAM-dependent methyltransferase [Desulfarculaceae bacterium]|nr:class I SAM-dependent methyltransferase [Desulfarculaceae bacterium]MCF8072763.1 class I SAM-dependent methyltransferase [Desulfarculaceae bacterium]MCF8100931.1 class I SAM-dependent methyltransferase [Desulfarculaceae bacterium]MCF8117585.1 class I SAM-dependent methyltransferase [Desulfarculaceae bacterium]